MNQIPVFSAGINVSGGTIAGTSASAQSNVIYQRGNGNGASGNQGYITGLSQLGFWNFRSHQAGGAGTHNDIWRVYDNTTDIRALDDWVDDYYDYVCDGCGKHSSKMFTCCGLVEWHDDVMALREMGRDEKVMERMVKMGVMHLDERDGWTAQNIQRANHFTWSGIYQNRERMDSQHEEMAKRLKELEEKLARLEKIGA